MTTKQYDLALGGCSTTPLISYVKALGLLRIVSEQHDRTSKGYWTSGGFHLVSTLSRDDLVSFFLNDYRPTPIVAPWNGGSGFYTKSNPRGMDETLVRIAQSDCDRLNEYRSVISSTNKIIDGLELQEKPNRDQKVAMLQQCRQYLPDNIVPWLDSAYVMSDNGPRFAPILGTGGNDGRLDFTINYMQRLVDVILDKDRASQSQEWFNSSVFGRVGVPLISASVGRFHPGGVGGPNASGRGFTAKSIVNPWDFILLMEGMLLFAGAASRRLNSKAKGSASFAFPFQVESSAAGWGSMSDADGPGSAKGEVWLPVWRNPATYGEVSYMFSEGRAEVGRRPARNGVDFARAAVMLGVDRGISSFNRFGFLNRSGKAYLAVPLGEVPVVSRKESSLLLEIDEWLRHASAGGQKSPSSIRPLLRNLDDAIFSYCMHGGSRRLQDIMVKTARLEMIVARSRGIRDKVRYPFQGFSISWLDAANDGSPEFRLAASITSINHPRLGPLRMNIEPVEQKGQRFIWTEDNPSVVWSDAGLVSNLISLLERRLIDGESALLKEAPIQGLSCSSLEDLNLYLSGVLDDRKIRDLVEAIAMVRWSPPGIGWGSSEEPALISRAFALLKLLYLPEPLRLGSCELQPMSVGNTLWLLKRGDLAGACENAGLRLRGNGLIPLTTDYSSDRGMTERILSALLFPVSRADSVKLAKLVLRQPEFEPRT